MSLKPYCHASLLTTLLYLYNHLFNVDRYSGITADMMKNVTMTIRDVQAKLLGLFNDKTILIGHSLDSDLIAVKVIGS